MKIHGDATARFAMERVDLVEGTYKLDVAMHKLDGYPFDYHRLLYTFRVKSRTKDVGIYRPAHEWSFSARSRSRNESDEDAAEIATYVRAARDDGRRVVFTNGVFDVLHPGHIRYLQQARALGDLLIVGLNSDASVRRNKDRSVL